MIPTLFLFNFKLELIRFTNRECIEYDLLASVLHTLFNMELCC